jgi:SAM-dependent methyltransferase
MTDPIWQATRDAATIYQDQIVPALMEEWAPRVVEAADIRPGQRVLDVACGTGVLTRAAAIRTGPMGTVTGLDLSPRMLAVAERLSPTLTWRQGTAEALPFPDESFDAVISQFGLMFVPDPVLALREMMRVLVPGGRLAVAVWASLTDTPAYAAEVALVERLAGAAAGAPLRAPFLLGEAKRLTDCFRAAGIKEPTVALQQGKGRFPSIRTMVELDLRVLLPIMDVVLEEERVEEILRQAEFALRPFVQDDHGETVFASPALVGTAVKQRGWSGVPA